MKGQRGLSWHLWRQETIRFQGLSLDGEARPGYHIAWTKGELNWDKARSKDWDLESNQCWVGAMSRRLKSGQQEELGQVSCDQGEEFRSGAPNEARKWFK